MSGDVGVGIHGNRELGDGIHVGGSAVGLDSGWDRQDSVGEDGG